MLTNAQYGVLDNDFDADGIATFGVGPDGNDTGYDVEVQQDGKILFLGTTTTPEGLATFVVRLFPDGSIDQSFGLNGAVFLISGSFESDCREMVIQPDGKIVMVGAGLLNGVYGVLVARLNAADGSLDSSFGINGMLHIPYASDSYLQDVALQSDGKIVAAGFSIGPDTDVLVVRLTEDGFLDDTFSFDGKVETDVNDVDVAQALVIGNDGKVTIAGASESQVGMFTLTEGLLIRYNSDGTLDNTFDTNGIIAHDINGYTVFNDIAMTGSGSIYTCGVATPSGSSDDDLLIAKFSSDGQFDTDFSTDGYDLYDFAGATSEDFANELILQPDGKVLLVGGRDEASDDVAGLVRYNDNGLNDITFGSSGEVTTPIDNQSAFEAVALQPDLKIVAFGTSLDITGTKAAVARYTSGMNVGIGEVEASIGSTLIYPNPITDNTITVEYELTSDETVSISLFDLNGRLISTLQSEIEEAKGVYQKQLSIPSVASGSYLLNLETEKGTVSVRLSVN